MEKTTARNLSNRILLFICIATCAAFLTAADTAHAWGRMGHDLSARVAGKVLAKDTKKPFFQSRAYDLGYYCNVPDLVWKKTSYEVESSNHFMDLEIFERELRKAVEEGRMSPKEDPYELSRAAFDAKFPSIPQSAGRAYWRIREFEKRLQATSDLLKQKDILKEERHRLQLEWLTIAGTMGHYITDLSQPLHVTENYDGQMTDQKGVHAYFEDTLVDELWPSIDSQVYKEAERMWEKEQAARSGKTTIALLKELASGSAKELDELLKRDKRGSREDLKKATELYRPMIVRRLASGSVVLAEIMRRHSNWQPTEEKFYAFSGEPAFVDPPKALPTPAPTPKSAKK